MENRGNEYIAVMLEHAKEMKDKFAAQRIRTKPHYAKQWEPVTQEVLDDIAANESLGEPRVIKDYKSKDLYVLVMLKGSGKPSYIKETWKNAQPASLRGIIVDGKDESIFGTFPTFHAASNDLNLEDGKVDWMVFKLNDEMILYSKFLNFVEDHETVFFDKFSGVRYLTTY